MYVVLVKEAFSNEIDINILDEVILQVQNHTFALSQVSTTKQPYPNY